MTERERYITALAKKKGWTPQQTENFRKYGDAVAFTESNNNPNAVQIGGGPGRGKYQYEVGGSVQTALNRLKSFNRAMGIEDNFTKKDREILSSKDPDFSKLSEDAQDAVFVADTWGKAPTDEIASGQISPEDTWVKYHWAGNADGTKGDDEAQRRGHFREAQEYRMSQEDMAQGQQQQDPAVLAQVLRMQ